MGRIVKLDQRSGSWEGFRLKGLGSSDAPVIMRSVSWKTPYELWEEKTKRVQKSFQPNWAMERGTRLEPKARASYEIRQDANMPAVVMLHDELDCIFASFDGHNSEISRDLEIKCPGKDDHETALSGEVPEKYKPQVQHLLMVSGSKELHYFSYNPDFPEGSREKIVSVKPDLEYQKTLLEAELKFWECVQNDTPPELSPKDFKELNDDESVSLFSELKRAKLAQDHAASLYESLKKKIVEKIEHARVRCAGVQMIRATRKGSIEYSKIPELQGVDLEKFRKKPTSFVEFRIQKESA